MHATLSSINLLSLNRIDCIRNEYTELLEQFPELTKDETVKHGITHKIVTKVFARPRRLAPDKLVTTKREFDKMIKLGVIEPSDSEWSSGVTVDSYPCQLAPCQLVPMSTRTTKVMSTRTTSDVNSYPVRQISDDGTS